MTVELKDDGKGLMRVTAGPRPDPRDETGYRTHAEWQANLAEFEAALREPAPIDHARIYDQVNGRKPGTTAQAEHDARDDTRPLQAETLDVELIYATFNAGRG